MSPKRHPNPFRIHGIVTGPFFTDRLSETTRVRKTLEEPTAKLLVSGYRRMGKSSTLARAVEEVNTAGGHAILADFSTASTVTDMANNLLAAAGKTLGRRWTSLVTDLMSRFQASLKLTPDPASGLTLPSLDVGLRQESLATQQATLANVLNTLNELAAERGTTLGIVLDEFQEITRFGVGPDARTGTTGQRRRSEGKTDAPARLDQPEWHLRGVIQHHQHVSYVLAGSKPSLLDAMVGRNGAFYNMLDRFAFGPIERAHMQEWIDERLRSVDLHPEGAGALCVDWAGPRTRDIVRLARKCVDQALPGGTIDAAAVTAAFREIVDEDQEAIHQRWQQLSTQQQNVLRALAAEPLGPTTKDMRRRFSLDASSTGNTLKTLIHAGDLVRSAYGSTYAFDDPFVRGWVIARALPDLGIRDKAITHVATPTSEYDA